MNRKGGMEGLIFEIIFIILTTIIVILMQSFYTNNLFLAGVIKLKDDAYKHQCSTILPLLVGKEYIKTSSTEVTGAVKLLYEQLGIKDVKTYPSVDYLNDRVKDYWGERFASRASFKVVAGDIVEGELANYPGDTICTFPLHGVDTTGLVTAEMNFRGYI